MFGAGRVGLALFAQRVNENPQVVVFTGVARSPYLLEKLPLSQHQAPMLHQHREQFVFNRRQVNERALSPIVTKRAVIEANRSIHTMPAACLRRGTRSAVAHPDERSELGDGRLGAMQAACGRVSQGLSLKPRIAPRSLDRSAGASKACPALKLAVQGHCGNPERSCLVVKVGAWDDFPRSRYQR